MTTDEKLDEILRRQEIIQQVIFGPEVTSMDSAGNPIIQGLKPTSLQYWRELYGEIGIVKQCRILWSERNNRIAIRVFLLAVWGILIAAAGLAGYFLKH